MNFHDINFLIQRNCRQKSWRLPQICFTWWYSDLAHVVFQIHGVTMEVYVLTSACWFMVNICCCCFLTISVPRKCIFPSTKVLAVNLIFLSKELDVFVPIQRPFLQLKVMVVNISPIQVYHRLIKKFFNNHTFQFS